MNPFISGDVPEAGKPRVVMVAPAPAGSTLKLGVDFADAAGVWVRVAFGNDGTWIAVHEQGFNVKSSAQSDGHRGSPTIGVPAGTTRINLLRKPSSATNNTAPMGFVVEFPG